MIEVSADTAAKVRAALVNYRAAEDQMFSLAAEYYQAEARAFLADHPGFSLPGQSADALADAVCLLLLLEDYRLVNIGRLDAVEPAAKRRVLLAVGLGQTLRVLVDRCLPPEPDRAPE